MEVDQNLLFNYASIVVTSLLVIVTTLTVFQKLKWRWPSKVNCWFCNKNTKIWKQQLNWWLCPHCEQYNGFTKSGDYAYSIPEQYKSSPNHNARKYCTSKNANQHVVKNNGLCQKCNHYEGIKLSKLSEFQPISERNFDYEIQEYKNSLEEKYPLCKNCKSIVSNVLHKQSLWLAQYKMLLFKQKPIRLIINNTKYSGSVFRIISTILDSLVTCNTELLLLPIGGLFFQLCACWATPTKKRSIDIILAFLWICIIVLIPFKDLKLLKTDFNTVWFSLDHITQHHMIMLFAFIIAFLNIKPRSNNVTRNMSFKKVDSSPKSSASKSCNESVSYGETCSSKMSTKSTETVMSSPISLANNCALVSGPRLTKPSVSPNPFGNLTSQTFTPTESLIYKNSGMDFTNHSLNTFSTLSLSEDTPKYTPRPAKLFEKRTYSTSGSSLFKKTNITSNRKPILSPPKLKSVLQTSWVAGGYWQDGIDVPSLSRSSSQSSGFGSACSNFAPSREPSVHEFDQCSVISDITQNCYPVRPNSVNSVGSLSQQTSVYSFTEPKSPIYNQTMRYTPNQGLTPPVLFTRSHQNGSPIYMDPCLQNPRLNLELQRETGTSEGQTCNSVDAEDLEHLNPLAVS